MWSTSEDRTQWRNRTPVLCAHEKGKESERIPVKAAEIPNLGWAGSIVQSAQAIDKRESQADNECERDHGILEFVTE